MALKVDLKGLFIKLSTDLDALAKAELFDIRNAVLANVLDGTSHHNLLAFQNDFSIDPITKTSRYSAAISLISVYEKGITAKIEKSGENVHQILTNKVEELQKQLSKLAEQIKNKRVEEIVVKYPDKEVHLKEEKFHKQLAEIFSLLSARNVFGLTEFLYVYGAPGSGKTHMSYQLGKLLGFTPDRIFCYPMSPMITDSKLLGFNNFASGSFIKGWLYEAYKNGGLVVLDEGDLAEAQVFASTNSIDNSTYCFGNGEFVKRHKDFYLVIWANTIGTGSTRGFTRNVLDAATRDRFAFYKLEYDEEMEVEIYGWPEWTKVVQVIREHVESHMEGSFYVTPRASRKGYAYRHLSVEKLLEILVFKGCARNIRDQILNDPKVAVAIEDFKKITNSEKKEVGTLITGKRFAGSKGLEKEFLLKIKATPYSDQYKPKSNDIDPLKA